MRRHWPRWVAGVALVAVLLAACGSSREATPQQFSPKRIPGLTPLSSLEQGTYVRGFLRQGAGRFLEDPTGRIVTLHGVNAVEKRPPYRLTVLPGRRNSLTQSDTVRLAKLGLNVVRIGILWQGIEPGHGGANQPSVCTPGTPVDPHMWNEASAAAYLDQVARVVHELGQRHIYSILDMHQDVWSQSFGGEGFPRWATCTSGAPLERWPGRWSTNYRNPAVVAAFNHFFDNDVIGNLQGEFQRAWRAVARTFANNSWVAGYDLLNEPADYRPVQIAGQLYSARLACFYAGSGGAARILGGSRSLPCPSDTPRLGVIQAIEASDKHHLIFAEADNASRGSNPYLLGQINVPRIADNFHVYCSQRSGMTGNPTSVTACAHSELESMARRELEREQMTSPLTPDGPAPLLSEFGATSNPLLARRLQAEATSFNFNWIWWSWRFYDDPTGSSDEALIGPRDRYRQTKSAIITTYAPAIAGYPLSTYFDPRTDSYTLTFDPQRHARLPTSIFIPENAYPNGYCASVIGGEVTSKAGAAYVTVVASNTVDRTTVTVRRGRCRERVGAS